MSSRYISQILNEYDKKRTNAEEEAKKRLLEVYKKIPRIREIDAELSSLGIEITKSILSKNGNVDSLIQKLKQKSIDLKMEKGELLSKNNIPLDYISPKYECQKCKDTGYIGFDRCSCLKQRIIDFHYNQSNLKDMLGRENFETFIFDYYSPHKFENEVLSPRKNIEQIFSICVNFVKEFENSSENLFFYGGSGLGKTFLSNCIAKDLLDRGKVVVYQTASNLLEIMREGSFSGNDLAKDKVEDIFECDLLIIDDLGTEYYKTEFSQMELYNILNKRLLSKKKMIISTNLYLQEMLQAYAERITSRILGNFTICKFYGEDIRVKVAEQNRKKRKR